MYTTQEILTGSILLEHMDELGDDYRPISDARVYLTYDQKGQKPVVGYSTRTDKTGWYEIDTKDIPPAEREYNCYFLIIEKDGYEPIKHKIGLRVLSPYVTNTAILKPLKK